MIRCRFERTANTIFLAMCRENLGLPPSVLADMQRVKRVLCDDFRMLDRDGQPVEHFPGLMRRKYGEVIAGHEPHGDWRDLA